MLDLNVIREQIDGIDKQLVAREGNDFYHEMQGAKVLDKVAMVFGQMNEPPGNRLRVALTGLTMAESFRDEGKDILLFIDNI